MKKSYSTIINTGAILHADKETSWEKLHKRDRNIYLSLVASKKLSKTSSRESLWLNWLEQLLPTVYGNTISTGIAAERSLNYSSIILGIISFLIGLTSSISFLYYAGQTPINVLSFLLIFVGSQLLLYLVTIIFLLAGKNRGGNRSPIFELTEYITKKIIKEIQAGAAKHFDSKKHEQINKGVDVFEQIRFYTPSFHLSILLINQTIGIFFNLGLILGSLFKILTSDLAFGWQTTLQIKVETLQKVVEIASLPWSWLITNASPTIDEIIGSKIILKDSIAHLANQNLASWWPFLILCLICYGLLPRCILWCSIRYKQYLAITDFIKQNPEIDRVLQRMNTPVVDRVAENNNETKKQDVTLEPQAQPSNNWSENIHATRIIGTEADLPADDNEPNQSGSFPKALVFIPVDLAPFPDKTLNDWLTRHGLQIDKTITFMEDYDSDQEIINQLTMAPAKTNIVFIMEAEMVPLVESINFISKVQAITSGSDFNNIVDIVLFHTSSNQLDIGISTQQFSTWQDKITLLNNRHIQLMRPENIEAKI